jgi:hypothetical protein
MWIMISVLLSTAVTKSLLLTYKSKQIKPSYCFESLSYVSCPSFEGLKAVWLRRSLSWNVTLIQVCSWKSSNVEFSSTIRTEPYHQLLSEEHLRTAVSVKVLVYWGTRWLAVFFHNNDASKYIRWRIVFDSWLELRKKCIRGREVCLGGDKVPMDKLRGKWNSRTESSTCVIRTLMWFWPCIVDNMWK